MSEAEWVAIDEVTPWDENPRINDGAVKTVADSITRFGWGSPILCRGDGVVIAGHTRLKAAQELGLDKVLVRYMDLDPATAKALALADNKLGEIAEWDDGALAQILIDLDSQDLDLSGLGWSEEELEAYIKKTDSWDSSGGASGAMESEFGWAPFTVLNTRDGRWQERKREWNSRGINSTLGRDDDLAFSSTGYLAKRIEQAGGGTSTFDPVLCELVYRWFSSNGSLVLDPFSGGSVRGIVAALCGRNYVGMDLRSEQVEANREQWSHVNIEQPNRSLVADEPGKINDPEAVTPIEAKGGIWFKRDDKFVLNNANGGKVRTILKAAKGAAGIVTCGARQSTMIPRAAKAANYLGIGCRLHTASGEYTQGMKEAERYGAEIIQHKPGYLSVVKKRARDDANEMGWVEIPWAAECPENVEQAAAQVPDSFPDGVKRLVVCAGSGMTLAGILHGLNRRGLKMPVLAVRVGAEIDDRMDRWAPPEWRKLVTVVESPMAYSEEVDDNQCHGVRLDPVYEAKCIPFMEAGDMLWIVGMRSGVPVESVGDIKWIVGDSATALPECEADLVFSCPPYADLEVYSDDPLDLSNMDYADFLKAYGVIIAESCNRLKENRFACFVVGDIRDTKGNYRNFVSHTIQAFEAAGLALYNEAILVNSAGTLPLRAGKAFRASRKLGKCHQNVLVFLKGDASKAVQHCGQVGAWIDYNEEPGALNE